MSLSSRASAKMTHLGGILAILALSLLPFLASAQGTSGGGVTLENYITIVGGFINNFIIPALFAVAFVMFIWGITKFFIIKGASEEDRSSGKALALWGVIAFVFLLSIWGLTNVLVSSFGVKDGTILCPDYNKNCNGDGSDSTNTGGTATQNTQNTNTTNTTGNMPALEQNSNAPSSQTFPTAGNRNAQTTNQESGAGGMPPLEDPNSGNVEVFPVVDQVQTGGEGGGGGEG